MQAKRWARWTAPPRWKPCASKCWAKKATYDRPAQGLGQLPPEERPSAGAQINEVRAWLTERMDESLARLQAMEREAALRLETIDVTEPRPAQKIGASHPSPWS